MNDRIIVIAPTEAIPIAIATLIVFGLVGLFWMLATVSQLITTLRLERWFTQRFEAEVNADKKFKEALLTKLLQQEASDRTDADTTTK